MDAYDFIPIAIAIAFAIPIIIWAIQRQRIAKLICQLKAEQERCAFLSRRLDEYEASEQARQTIADILSNLKSTPESTAQRFYRVHRSHRSWGYVYLMCINNEYYKIGHAQDVKGRIGALQTGTPYKIETLHMISCHHAPRLEMILQNRYKHRWITGEWFKLSPDDITEFCTISSPVTVSDLDRLEGRED